MEKPKNVEEYINQQRSAVASNPECGNSHYNLAVGLLGLRKFDEAEKELLQAIECSPGLAEAYVQLGGICLQRGDLDGCLAYNQKAVKVRPGFSEGHGNIGFVHMQQGNLDEAIAALERATFFNFRFIQAFATLANAYLMKGDIEKCIETNKKVLDLEPDFAVVHNNLAIAYLETGDDASAVWHAERAVELGYEVAPEIVSEIQDCKNRLSHHPKPATD
jgi:tetratricopeptide (TPR) repeat protein